MGGGWWLEVGGWWVMGGGLWLVFGGWWLVIGDWWFPPCVDIYAEGPTELAVSLVFGSARHPPGIRPGSVTISRIDIVTL